MPRTFPSALGLRRLSPMACLVAGGLAFTLGIMIGLVIPVHLFALNLVKHQKTTTRQHISIVSSAQHRSLSALHESFSASSASLPRASDTHYNPVERSSPPGGNLAAKSGVFGSTEGRPSSDFQKAKRRRLFLAPRGFETQKNPPASAVESTIQRNKAALVMDASHNDIHETHRGDGISPLDDSDPSPGLSATTNTRGLANVAVGPVGYREQAGGPVTGRRSHGSGREEGPDLPGQLLRRLPAELPGNGMLSPVGESAVRRGKDNSTDGGETTKPGGGNGQTDIYATLLPADRTTAREELPGNSSGFAAVRSIVDGIYWTNELEERAPKGFSSSDVDAWRRFANATSVLKMEDGCGRMQNRLITFDGGQRSCCRYRQNNDQIQGEIFSFYLSQLLGIANLAPATLSHVQGPRHPQWLAVSPQLQLAQWNPERPMVLTQFVDELVPAYIPIHFQTKQRRLFPVPADVVGVSVSDLTDLVQWSDLIVFDYLTANLDRVVNNMYNEQWNADMMRYPAHNLARSSKTGLLIFLDNESGLLHGYRLLDKYEHFHLSLLDSLCIFRRRTAEAISKLHRTADIEGLLKDSFRRNDPGMENWLPFLPERSLKILRNRIATVFIHINKCQARFASSSTTTPERIPER